MESQWQYIDMSRYVKQLELARVEGKKTKDFSKVDLLQDQLKSVGAQVRSGPKGTQIKLRWSDAYSEMLASKNDERFQRLTGVDREEVLKWLTSKLEAFK